MHANEKTAIELQKQVSFLKASASETTFAQLPDDLRQILQAQYDNWARRSTQVLVKTAALGDTYAEPGLHIEREFRLEQQIRGMGGEPWQLPGDEGK
ncbi:hypothetical protein [Nodosilinea sp. FACHB-13]|uniref:hypothetical protein n=1 Tax=Cyanophyceae TaxID=3028117 RepID=UPI0016895FF0|nr:hypothetical protein [Nodosilinea sp. FACHB-13]MBD2106708.1 hypothetical protein [Nodosilinea sp. FACHB-13]